MKILLITDRMETGGAETHVAQLAMGLWRMGEDVTLLSGGGRLADALEKQGIRQIRMDMTAKTAWKMWKTRRALFQLVKSEKFEICHAHARLPAALMRGIRRLGCAEIVTVHARFRHNLFLRLVCNWGERTVAVSEDLRGYVCDIYGVPAERVDVIANGIDQERFSTSDINDMPLDHTPRRVLFASRLDADCSIGAELLCRVAERLCRVFPDLRICIAGGGSEYLRIKKLANEVNHTLGIEAVEVMGQVDDMPTLLAKQDIFVGVSRAAMEAAAGGRAVILCGNEGYLGILTEENAEVASHSNFCGRGAKKPSEMALESDLLELLCSTELWKRSSAVGKRLINSRYTADGMCRKTLALYKAALHTPPDITLTVGGYFGCGNTGDDAILLGFLEHIRCQYPTAQVLALTGSPRRDSRRFGILCYNRKNPIAIFFAMARSEVFLCGGGSLLQNVTSCRSLRYYLSLLRQASRMACKTALFAAGIGPLIGKRANTSVSRVLKKCDYISLRDPLSMRYLSSMSSDPARLHKGADLALLMPLPPPERAFSILSSRCCIRAGQALLCVILRGDGEGADGARGVLIAAVRMLCRRHGMLPIFPIFDSAHDGEASRRAAAETGGVAVSLREPADATALLGAATVAITARLHALILSSCAGIPALGVSTDERDQKIAAYAKISGQEYLSAAHLTVGGVVEAVEELMRTRAERVSVICDAAEQMREEARRDIDRLMQTVTRKN